MTAATPFLSRPVVRILLPIVIAVVLGPLMSALVYFLAALAIMIADRSGWPDTLTEAISLQAQFFVIVVAVAYYKAGLIALAAGVLVAIWMAWRPPGLAVVIAAAILATFGYFVVVEPESFQPLNMDVPLNDFRLILLFAVIAATLCWFLARRLVRPA